MISGALETSVTSILGSLTLRGFPGQGTSSPTSGKIPGTRDQCSHDLEAPAFRAWPAWQVQLCHLRKVPGLGESSGT